LWRALLYLFLMTAGSVVVGAAGRVSCSVSCCERHLNDKSCLECVSSPFVGPIEESKKRLAAGSYIASSSTRFPFRVLRLLWSRCKFRRRSAPTPSPFIYTSPTYTSPPFSTLYSCPAVVTGVSGYRIVAWHFFFYLGKKNL
jgi:hypothetical protein